MKTATRQINCATFQNQLPELIASGEGFSNHPHYQTCEMCRALLSDLEIIADKARQLFPIIDPPDAVWDKLQIAIESDRTSFYSA